MDNRYGWIDHGNYWEHTAPQGSQEWLDQRIGRITTCVSGALAGYSKFKTPEEQGKITAGIVEEVFNPHNIDLMNHGNATEPIARSFYEDYIGRPIIERGLIVPKWDLMLGASIDGDIVGTDGIIEIKCPKKMYKGIQQYMDLQSVGWNPPPGYYGHIFSSHMAQMQHGMVVTGKKWCTYIVYSVSDKSVFTQKIPFDPVYWENHYKTIKKNYNMYVYPYLKSGYPTCPSATQ